MDKNFKTFFKSLLRQKHSVKFFDLPISVRTGNVLACTVVYTNQYARLCIKQTSIV